MITQADKTAEPFAAADIGDSSAKLIFSTPRQCPVSTGSPSPTLLPQTQTDRFLVTHRIDIGHVISKAKVLLIILVVVSAEVSISLLAIYSDKFPSWSGLVTHSPQNAPQGYERSKTLWDWMGLLLIPLGLVFVAFFLNSIEKQRDKDRNQETTLQSYLDNMTNLLLEKGLLTSEPGAEIKTIARARTIVDEESRKVAHEPLWCDTWFDKKPIAYVV